MTQIRPHQTIIPATTQRPSPLQKPRNALTLALGRVADLFRPNRQQVFLPKSRRDLSVNTLRLDPHGYPEDHHKIGTWDMANEIPPRTNEMEEQLKRSPNSFLAINLKFPGGKADLQGFIIFHKGVFQFRSIHHARHDNQHLWSELLFVTLEALFRHVGYPESISLNQDPKFRCDYFGNLLERRGAEGLRTITSLEQFARDHEAIVDLWTQENLRGCYVPLEKNVKNGPKIEGRLWAAHGAVWLHQPHLESPNFPNPHPPTLSSLSAYELVEAFFLAKET